MNLGESLDDSVIGWFGLEVSIEQEWVTRCTPRVGVAHTPDSDRYTRRDGQASLDNGDVVVCSCVDDVELYTLCQGALLEEDRRLRTCDCNLFDARACSELESGLNTASTAGLQTRNKHEVSG